MPVTTEYSTGTGNAASLPAFVTLQVCCIVTAEKLPILMLVHTALLLFLLAKLAASSNTDKQSWEKTVPKDLNAVKERSSHMSSLYLYPARTGVQFWSTLVLAALTGE